MAWSQLYSFYDYNDDYNFNTMNYPSGATREMQMFLERQKQIIRSRQSQQFNVQAIDYQPGLAYTVTADGTTQIIKANQSVTNKPTDKPTDKTKEDKLKNLIAHYYRRK